MIDLSDCYYINVLEVGQCFGGPEEGGWYYTAGDNVQTMVANTLAEAQKIKSKIELELKERKVNYRMGFGAHDGVDPNGECDDSYLLAGGMWGESEYVVRIAKERIEGFPQERPRYE